MKHGSNSVHGNVWKKYYVILLPWTLVIFFWDGHGFVLKHSILMNVRFIWGTRDIKRSNINFRTKGKERKRNGTRENLFVNVFSSPVCDVILQEQKDNHVKETNQLPCLKRKLVRSALLCIWFVDKQRIL